MDYRQKDTQEFAAKVKAWGFRVWIASRGTYGIISDDTGARVLSFSCDGPWSDLGGNYGPPSQESGTGWKMEQTPGDMHTAEDVRRALYANPPLYCGKGWKSLTTLEQHLATYGRSSQYVEVTGCDYYAEKLPSGFYELRQTRFIAARRTRGGEGHEHDVCAVANSVDQLRETVAILSGSVDWSRVTPSLWTVTGNDRQHGAQGVLEPFRVTCEAMTAQDAVADTIKARNMAGREHVSHVAAVPAA